ncbi:MAG: TonB-dependent receptor, partial [Gammaproteobacteria bacterium]|nr:TonB-dependent receptor [Gammaproteobacteria bacterium]
LWDVRSDTQLYMQYAHGFRAPPFEDVNIGFDIPLFNYRAIPNPSLDAETSDGIELGARFQGNSYRAAIAVFGVEYDDLIQTRVNLGRQPGTGTLLFQSRNVDEARVYGAEINVNADLGRWVEGVSFDASASWVRGKDRSNDEPLNTIDPLELVAALTWQPHERTRLAFVTTAVASQNRVDDSSSDIVQTDGFAVFDMTASYTTASGIRVDAGVFNLFDKTYWRWSSVRNRTVDDPMLNHLSAPERYASVSVRMDF